MRILCFARGQATTATCTKPKAASHVFTAPTDAPPSLACGKLAFRCSHDPRLVPAPVFRDLHPRNGFRNAFIEVPRSRWTPIFAGKPPILHPKQVSHTLQAPIQLRFQREISESAQFSAVASDFQTLRRRRDTRWARNGSRAHRLRAQVASQP